MKASTSKIARLPRLIRLELARRIEDGATGRSLVRWLNGLAHVQTVLEEHFAGRPITEQNVSDWRQTGYLHLLRQQETLEFARSLATDAHDITDSLREHFYSDRLATLLSIRLSRVALALADEETDPKKQLVQLRDLSRDVSRWRLDDDREERRYLQRERLAVEGRRKARRRWELGHSTTWDDEEEETEDPKLTPADLFAPATDDEEEESLESIHLQNPMPTAHSPTPDPNVPFVPTCASHISFGAPPTSWSHPHDPDLPPTPKPSPWVELASSQSFQASCLEHKAHLKPGHPQPPTNLAPQVPAAPNSSPITYHPSLSKSPENPEKSSPLVPNPPPANTTPLSPNLTPAHLPSPSVELASSQSFQASCLEPETHLKPGHPQAPIDIVPPVPVPNSSPVTHPSSLPIDPSTLAENTWYRMRQGLEPFDSDKLNQLYAAIPKK